MSEKQSVYVLVQSWAGTLSLGTLFGEIFGDKENRACLGVFTSRQEAEEFAVWLAGPGENFRDTYRIERVYLSPAIPETGAFVVDAAGDHKRPKAQWNPHVLPGRFKSYPGARNEFRLVVSGSTREEAEEAWARRLAELTQQAGA